MIQRDMPFLKQLLQRLLPYRFKPDNSVRETIEDLIEEDDHVEENSLDREEKYLLGKTLSLRDLTAYDVMVPRADILAVADTFNFEQVLTQFVESGYTRLPVYHENLDHVLGFIHVRSLLDYEVDPSTFKCSQIIQEALFVSPSMRLLDLLLQMRLSRMPIAFVVDEFGGVDGMVTSWDIIQELIGDIESAEELNHSPKITRISDGSLIINARLEIENYEKEFGEILPAKAEGQDIDTIGGLVIDLAGRVPAIGERIFHPEKGLAFDVLDADPRRVKRVRLYRVAPASTVEDTPQLS